MTLIKYRTTATPYNQHAVVPEVWLSDLLDWLKLSDAKIVSTTDNIIETFDVPINWPSYETCQRYVCISDLFVGRR